MNIIDNVEISYEGLRIELAKRRWKWCDLGKRINCSKNVLTKLNQDDFVSLKLVANIAHELDCDIGDIVKLKRVKNKPTK